MIKTERKIEILEMLLYEYTSTVKNGISVGLCGCVYVLDINSEERRFLYSLIDATQKRKRFLYDGVFCIRFEKNTVYKGSFYLWSVDNTGARIKWIESHIKKYKKILSKLKSNQ